MDNLGVSARGLRAGAIHKPSIAIFARLHFESTPKRPAESFVALKTAGQRDLENRIVAAKQKCRGAVQTKPLDKVLGCLAGDGREHAMQIKG